MENVKAVHDGDAPQPDRVTMFMCPCCRMVFREYDNYMRHWSEERDRVTSVLHAEDAGVRGVQRMNSRRT